jgi:hypothetical protein
VHEQLHREDAAKHAGEQPEEPEQDFRFTPHAGNRRLETHRPEREPHRPREGQECRGIRRRPPERFAADSLVGSLRSHGHLPPNL